MFKQLSLLRRAFCTNLIKQSSEQSSIFRTRRNTIKDRFDLHTLTNIQYMCHLVRTNKYKLTHQQNIALFYRLSQVFEILGKSIYYYDEFGLQSQRIMANFRNPSDVASLGTFIQALTKANMYKEQQWAYIYDFIDQRKYAEEHDEVFGIITGFKNMKQRFAGTWLEQKTVHIYRQLFDVTLLHIKQRRYNLKQMREIVHCFHKYGVNEDYVWEEIQYWMKTKLREIEQKPFTNLVIVNEADVDRVMFSSKIVFTPILEELVEIAYALAYNKMPTLEFIQFSQKLVSFYLKNKKALEQEYQRVLESLPQKNKDSSLPQHKKQLSIVKINPIFLSNEHIIYFLFVLKRTMDSHKQYYLDRQLYQWAINLVFQQYNRYTVSQIILLNHVHQFLEKTPQQMQLFTLNKIKIIRQNTVKLNDLKTLFQIVGLTNIDKLQSLLQHFLRNSHPSEIYLFTQFCEGYKAYIPQYFVDLPHMVNHHHKYFSFDQNCYFYYILLTNEVYWKGCALNSYHGQMEILKQTIKTSAFSRGFKIKMDSYFHKLLDHVNLADFFEGGN